jgi:hypothetical protein
MRLYSATSQKIVIFRLKLLIDINPEVFKIEDRKTEHSGSMYYQHNKIHFLNLSLLIFHTNWSYTLHRITLYHLFQSCRCSPSCSSRTKAALPPLVTTAPAWHQQSVLTVVVWPVVHALMAMASAVYVSHSTSNLEHQRTTKAVSVNLF